MEVVRDPQGGKIRELRCTYDPATRGGDSPDGRKVKATLHWVSAAHAVPAEVRLYDTLFTKRDVGEVEEGADWKANLNPKSLEDLTGCWVEPGLKDAPPASRWQFERLGYFCVGAKDSKPGKPFFTRTVTPHDPWANIRKAGRENQ